MKSFFGAPRALLVGTTAILVTGVLAAGVLAAGILWSGAASAGDSLPRQHEPLYLEDHLGSLTMLTDGAENAEAYFSADGQQLVFQSNRAPHGCDQIFTIPVAGGEAKLASTGEGRTTCAYFAADDRYIVYASTHLADADCPPPPDMSQGYVWAIYAGYDIFRLDRQDQTLTPLTSTPGYDAEPTVSPDGRSIVFTSVRDGDLDIYTMDVDGGNLRRLTDTPGYDGGPFFSPDGKQIVYRCHHPTDPDKLADYQRLLAAGLVRPSLMEVWVMDADGSNQRQITQLGCASFAPFFHPSGQKIIFSSNYPQPRGREFNLWLIDTSGENLEQVTFTEGFDGFPMWGPDGETFVFCSNRHNSQRGETNVFVTKWKE